MPLLPPRIPDRVPLKLTLDQASLLYEKLRRGVARPPRTRRTSLRVGTALSDPRYLLEILDSRLERLPATTPVSSSKRNVLRFRQRVFTLHFRPTCYAEA